MRRWALSATGIISAFVLGIVPLLVGEGASPPRRTAPAMAPARAAATLLAAETIGTSSTSTSSSTSDVSSTSTSPPTSTSSSTSTTSSSSTSTSTSATSSGTSATSSGTSTTSSGTSATSSGTSTTVTDPTTTIYSTTITETDLSVRTNAPTGTLNAATPTDRATLPPAAAFTWLPLMPRVGQDVSLLSTSTPGSSAIRSLAWKIDRGAYAMGPAARLVVFHQAGAHRVSLEVTDSAGLSSTVAATIFVSPRPLRLMQPFPVVRVAGSFSSSGATLTDLSVQAPPGAKIIVSCAGKGCPVRLQRRHIGSSSSARGVISFPAFERPLPSGTVLRVKVFAPGAVGKLTRLLVRAGKPPKRFDTCLSPGGKTALRCPR